ncbi:hypothetical protein CVT26_011326, partial [Gymnopilus dilepis]
FLKAFSPLETTNQAFYELRHLRQGKASAGELNTKFDELVRTAGITINNNDAVLIDYYIQTLSPWLLDKISGLDTVPTTIKGWQKKAVEFDNSRLNAARLLGRPSAGFRPSNWWANTTGHSRPARDPNAMDVDAVSTFPKRNYERDERRAKGLCYKCGEKGHLIKDCPKWKNEPNKNSPRKMKGRELYTHIKAMMTDLSEAEKEEIYQLGEKEGF